MPYLKALALNLIKGRIFTLSGKKLIYEGFKGVFKQPQEEYEQEYLSLDSINLKRVIMLQ